MKSFRFRVIIALTLAVALPRSSGTQQPGASEPLFVQLSDTVSDREANSAPVGSSAVTTRMIVGMRLDRLFGGPGGAAERLKLNVAQSSWTAVFERLESDQNGFRSWIGHIEGIAYSHVVFTERDGVVSGLLNAVGTTYQVRTLQAGRYALERVETHQLPTEDGTRRAMLAAEPAADRIVTAGVAGDQVIAGEDGSIIDVLMLYTPAARNAAGGASQIQAIASQVIADANTVMGRSGVTPRLRLVVTSEFAFTETAELWRDVFNLASGGTSGLIFAQQNLANADVVQLLVSSPDATTCGEANDLDPIGYNNFFFLAFSAADIECVAQYGPPHELFHTLGANHELGVPSSDSVFTYSHAYKDPGGAFRTVQAAGQCVSGPCPRIPNLSNPLIKEGGFDTGTSFENNARTLNETAYVASRWRRSAGAGSVVPPEPPQNLRTVTSGGDVTLIWDAATSATNYRVQVGSTPGVYTLSNGLVGNVTSTTMTLGVGTYYWRVIASNATGAGGPTSEAQFVVTSTCGIPTAPQSLVASVDGGLVTLAWQAPTLGRVSTYVVHVGGAPGTTDRYNLRTGTSHPQVSGRLPGGAYYVRVLAENGCGLSGPSNEEFLSIGGAPAAPRDLSLRIEGGIVRVDWNVSAGTQPVVAFIVEAGSAPGLANLASFDTGSTSTSLTTGRPGPGTYYVRVRARGRDGISEPSADAVLVVP